MGFGCHGDSPRGRRGAISVFSHALRMPAVSSRWFGYPVRMLTMISGRRGVSDAWFWHVGDVLARAKSMGNRCFGMRMVSPGWPGGGPSVRAICGVCLCVVWSCFSGSNWYPGDGLAVAVEGCGVFGISSTWFSGASGYSGGGCGMTLAVFSMR